MRSVARCLSVLAVMAVSLPAAADTIYLKNGDRISGEIKRIWDGELFIDTDYTDEFAVKMESIERIDSDRDFELELPDQSEVTGRFSEDSNGSFVFIDSAESIRVPIDEIRELEEPESWFDWRLLSDISLSESKGNTETRDIAWQAAGDLKFGDHRHRLELQIDREDQDNERIKEQQSAVYQYSWFFRDRWFFAAGIGYERDPLRLLTRRLTPGAGLGYQFFEDADRILEVTLAAVSVDERIAGETNQSATARWRTRFEQEVADDLVFFHNHQLLSYLDGRRNRVVDTETGLRWEVWEDIFFNVQLDWNRESEPAAGNRKEDLTYAFGIGIDLD